MLPLDITGEQYGRLTAIERIADSKRHTKWLFKCSCGTAVTASLDAVRSGNTQSCGCLRIEATRARSLTHGHSVDRAPTPEFRAWQRAKSRCLNPNDPKFPAYGGRGITMCEEWMDDAGAFLRHMGPRPSGTTLDRIDVNGHYAPGNCRWATPRTQGNNKRNTLWVTCPDGRRISMKEFAVERAIPYRALWARVKKGEALFAAAERLASKRRA